MLHVQRKSAERLDRIEGKKHAAPVQQAADGIYVNAVAGEKMAARERDESGFRRERRGDEVRCDFTGMRRLEQLHRHAAPPQIDPRIHVRRIVARAAHDLVARLPRDAVGEKAQAERGRAEQRDFVRIRADEFRAQTARTFDVAQHIAEFLRHLTRLPDVRAHRIRDARGQRGDGGVP